MKKTIACFFIVLTGLLSVSATNYYISCSSGDDNWNGKTPQTAWKTIGKVNTEMSAFLPGDSIFFRRGDIFSGSLNVSVSGNALKKIYFGAYGTGNDPVISGLKEISSWIHKGNGIWEASCPECGTEINMLLINNRQYAPGRYPNADEINKGYLTIDSHIGNTQITDNDLPANPNWSNAQIVVRKVRWVIDKGTVQSHSGATLTISGALTYELANGFGYFFQNHLNALDKNGEWQYNPGSKILSMYFNGADPNNYTIEVSVLKNLVTASSENDLTFRNIIFKGPNETSADFNTCSNIVFTQCKFLFSGYNALDFSNCSDILIDNNTIRNTNNLGFVFLPETAKGCTFRNNIVQNTGTFPGLGRNGNDTYQAVIIRGIGINIENNVVDSTGYIAIRFEGDSVLVKNNFISNYCFVKDDGGGIYTWNGSSFANSKYRRIIDNIVINAIGAPEGTDSPLYNAAEGIYMDDNANDVAIKGNTVANIGRAGIFLHNAHEIDVLDNTVYNCDVQLYGSHDSISPNTPIRNCHIKNNIFFSEYSSQEVMSWRSIKNDIKLIGIMDSNYYCRPVNENFIISTSFYNNGYISEKLSLSGWKTNYFTDSHSKGSPVLFNSFIINNTIGSNKVVNSYFETNTGNWYCWTTKSNCNIVSETGALPSGKSMKASFSPASGDAGNYMYIIGKCGQLEKDKKYLLTFDAVSSKDNIVSEVFLRKGGSPYQTVSDIISPFIINKTPRTYEFLFTATETQPDGVVDFKTYEKDSTLWLDNIELFEVDASVANPDDSILFEYNASQKVKTVHLLYDYIDVYGNNYIQGADIPVQPFQSIILLRKKALPVSVSGQSGKTNFIIVYPNPAKNTVTLKNTEHTECSVELLNTVGQILLTKPVAGKSVETLDISNFRKGLYFIRVCNAKNQTTDIIIIE